MVFVTDLVLKKMRTKMMSRVRENDELQTVGGLHHVFVLAAPLQTVTRRDLQGGYPPLRLVHVTAYVSAGEVDIDVGRESHIRYGLTEAARHSVRALTDF